jgi:putative flippase GtrA
MLRRIGFRARDLAARLEALRTGFFRRDAVRFVMVGSLGFTIEFGILVALVHGANWSPFLARAVAMATAFFCTWLLHRHWTFASGRVRSPLPQSLLYGTFQVISLSVNYGIFSALVLAGGLWRSYPVLAAVGSLSPAVISYVLSKWVAFAKPRELAKLPSEGR